MVYLRKYYFYILISLTLSFIFIFWIIKGFNYVLDLDYVKEMIGNAIYFKFTNTLVNQIIPQYYSGDSFIQLWYTPRWSTDIVPFITYQIIEKVYAFVTKDPISAGYLTQGFCIAIYYTLSAWILTLYTSTILHIAKKSYLFIFLLFCFGIITFIMSIFNISAISPNIVKGALHTHYIFPTALLLYSIYPFWTSFFKNTWNTNYNSLHFRILWYILITFTAFSYTAVTVLFILVQILLGLVILIYICPKNIIHAFKFLIISPPQYLIDLYYGGCLCLIAILSESIFGFPDNKTITSLQNISIHNINLLQQSLVKIVIFYIIFYIIIYCIQKHFRLSEQNDLIYKKIFHSAIFINIVTLIYTILVYIKRDCFLNIYGTPIVILSYIPFLILIIKTIINLNSPIIYSFLLFFFFSHYLYYLPYYPNNISHKNDYIFYEKLYQQNKLPTNNQIIIISTPPLARNRTDNPVIKLLEMYTKDIGLIDPDVTLIYKSTNYKKSRRIVILLLFL